MKCVLIQHEGKRHDYLNGLQKKQSFPQTIYFLFNEALTEVHSGLTASLRTFSFLFIYLLPYLAMGALELLETKPKP